MSVSVLRKQQGESHDSQHSKGNSVWSVPGWELTASSQASGNSSQGSSSEFRVQPWILVQVPGQAVHKHLSTPALDGPDASGLL